MYHKFKSVALEYFKELFQLVLVVEIGFKLLDLRQFNLICDVYIEHIHFYSIF